MSWAFSVVYLFVLANDEMEKFLAFGSPNISKVKRRRKLHWLGFGLFVAPLSAGIPRYFGWVKAFECLKAK